MSKDHNANNSRRYSFLNRVRDDVLSGQIQDAMKKVEGGVAEYSKTLGDRQAESETAADLVVRAIESYAESLTEALELSYQPRQNWPVINCTREIKNRLRKLKEMDADREEQVRITLKTRFPGRFDHE